MLRFKGLFAAVVARGLASHVLLANSEILRLILFYGRLAGFAIDWFGKLQGEPLLRALQDVREVKYFDKFRAPHRIILGQIS